MPATARGLPYPALSDAPNGPLQLGQLAQAIDDEFEAQLTGTTTFQPALTAATTNPTLGTGGVRKSWYVVHDDIMVDFCFFVQFGTSGTAAGNGQYRVSLPFPAATLIGSGPEGFGTGLLRDESATNVFEVTWHIPGGTPTLVAGYAQDSSVNHSAPFAWAAQDWLAGSIRYRKA